ncbi:PAS domain S-box protein [Candidatus Saccharibacteria bacterium]|nr:PAS domain S-box protein [Candidatus Saccharibacteria bacterium]
MLFDGQGLCLSTNKPGLRMMQTSEEMVVGKPFRDIWPEDIRPNIDEHVSNVLSGQTCSFQAYRMDGDELGWWDVSLGPIQGKDGTVEKFIAISTSITERKRAEEELKLTQFTVDNAAESIFWVQSDARFVYVNEAACNSLGYSREELLSMTVYDIDPDFPKESWPDHWREIKEQGSFSLETNHRTKNGMVFPVEVSVNYLKYGEREYNCAFVRDITERKLAEKETVRAAQLASVGEMAAGVALEINNPLNGIINYAEILASRVQEEKQKEVADRIISEGDRISRIVSSLLSFSRMDDETALPVKVEDLISEVMNLVSSQLAKNDIEVDVKLSPDLPYIRVNPQQIEQVFLCLIANARDAIIDKQYWDVDKKSINIEGEIVNIDGKDCVRISFTDNGIGMPGNIIAKATAPFFTTKGRRGTGLGLSVSQSIINDHGGKLEIESEEDKFTRVTIYLPAGRGSGSE